jgi:hypothetical protein
MIRVSAGKAGRQHEQHPGHENHAQYGDGAKPERHDRCGLLGERGGGLQPFLMQYG